MNLRLNTFILFGLISLFSCKDDRVKIELIKTNFNLKQSFSFDYSNAFEKGFIVPNKEKDNISSFKFQFKVENFQEDTLYYKLLYQNESYKFDEANSLSSENFYGCSELSLTKFNKVGINNEGEFIINDSIIIKGNPREERRYFGGASRYFNKDSDTLGLANAIIAIKSDSVWFEEIIQKAKTNKIDINSQLRQDGLWLLKSKKNIGSNNNRWKRNPRVGTYSACLVIAKRTSAGITPMYVSNSTIMSPEGYINPYHYFKNVKRELYETFTLDSFIAITAKVPINNGIYIPNDKPYKKDFYNDLVNDGVNLYNNSAFQIHETSLHDRVVENVPIKAKFLSENYTKQDYDRNRNIYQNNRVNIFFNNTNTPGKTFGIDTLTKTLWFKNPYYKNEYRKENVGIKTRHGLTYGKYTFKIKMSKLLTKDNVWTGLTNALWLAKESEEEWNNRRICNKEGFMPFYGAGKEEQRVPQISYSEIDFEILKTAEFWPNTSYADKKERQDPITNDNKVMVTCTNWDMACKQPNNFGTGVQEITYDNKLFYPHRWDDFYNAITAKKPESDDELFGGEYYFFQIEWKPTEIIWRIGPSKDKLRVVCYMNDEITTIPNNQMIALITQEYHFADWWPKSPYKQENIPFPGEDLKGRLYSLEIE